MREPSGYRQQVLHPMAHLSRQQFVTFLRLFAAGYVQEDSEHGPSDNANVFPATARGDPPDFLSEDDAEVGLITTGNAPCGSERCTNSVPIRWVNTGRQM